MADYPVTDNRSAVSSQPTRRTGLLGRSIRLGMGGIAFGVSAVQGQVRNLVESEGRTSTEPPSTFGRVVEGALDGAIGMAVAGEDMARRGAAVVWNANRRAWEATAPLRQPLDALGVTDLALKPVEAVRSRVEPAVARLQEAGQAELEASRQLTLTTITDIVDTIVAYLNQSPQVEALIRTQVDRLLPVLAEHPGIQALVQRQVDLILPVLAEDAAVQQLIQVQVDKILPALADNPGVQELIDAQLAKILPELKDNALIQELIRVQAGQYLQHLQDDPDPVQALIRVQGDAYIAYLNEHPDSVQNLVSGQSASLAGQMMDEVRERTVTADSVTEMLVRNILRRRSRSELPPPPEQVQRRAEATVLPSDYIRREARFDDR